MNTEKQVWATDDIFFDVMAQRAYKIKTVIKLSGVSFKVMQALKIYRSSGPFGSACEHDWCFFASTGVIERFNPQLESV